jgi:hypothetical protein
LLISSGVTNGNSDFTDFGKPDRLERAAPGSVLLRQSLAAVAIPRWASFGYHSGSVEDRKSDAPSGLRIVCLPMLPVGGVRPFGTTM